MYYDTFTLCDNLRLTELAGELHNEVADMDLAIFIQVAISDHLNDEHDCIFKLGTIAEIRLCPKDGEVELTIWDGPVAMNHYLFDDIKDWSFAKLIYISDEFAEIIDHELHERPHRPDIEKAFDYDC